MSSWQRRLAAAAVGVLACGVTLASLSLPAAYADNPPLTFDQAKAQLTALQKQIDDLEKQIEQSEDTMNQALVDQADLQDQLAAQQQKIDAMAPAFAEMVNGRRQVSGLGDAVKFFLNDDPDQFLAHIGMTTVVQTVMDEQMALLGAEKQRLNDLNDELAATIASVKAQVDGQKALLTKQQKAEAAAAAIVDKMTASQRQSLGLGGAATLGVVQPQTKHLIEVVKGLFPQITSVGTLRPGTSGEHNHGLAADFMIPDYKNNVALGWNIAHYVMDHAAELGVKYIIWQQSIWITSEPGKGWRKMASRGNDTANHYDHVHVTLYLA